MNKSIRIYENIAVGQINEIKKNLECMFNLGIIISFKQKATGT